jgi:DNA-binding NarL/FixJ family response regulator
MHIADIRAGLDIAAVMREHDPVVIVYDVVMPYDRNWRFLEHLRETSFKDRRFVITTPNETGIKKLVGKDDKIYEVIDDGGDIDEIVQAVREAARARPTR